MRRYQVFYAISVFYAVVGFISICFIEDYLGISIVTIAAFCGCIWYGDLAKDIKNRIRDAASMDRPE